MNEKKHPLAEPVAADRNVDQIRDILFGGQMRDYERRFQELNQRIEADLAQLRQDHERRCAALEQRLDEQVEKLVRAQRQESVDRTKAVDDLESRLLQAARTQRTEINNAIESVVQEISASDERLRKAIAELDAALKDHSARIAQAQSRSQDELRSEKLGREDLANLLAEVALRLKGEFDLPGKR
ncbi:MAG: hypothetical protein ABI411_01155 [Tahibacter sp.]